MKNFHADYFCEWNDREKKTFLIENVIPFVLFSKEGGGEMAKTHENAKINPTNVTGLREIGSVKLHSSVY